LLVVSECVQVIGNFLLDPGLDFVAESMDGDHVLDQADADAAGDAADVVLLQDLADGGAKRRNFKTYASGYLNQPRSRRFLAENRNFKTHAGLPEKPRDIEP